MGTAMVSTARGVPRRMASVAVVVIAATPLLAQQTSAPRPGVVISNAPPPPTGAAIPPPSPAAQRLIDQWKLDHASIIEQLRGLQLAYRDAGRAEDAAAIAANIRQLQQRTPPVTGSGKGGGGNE